jgi:MinD superfamily P-loop ATPase
MKLAVASGKGGTGKSMVAANLAFALAQTGGITLVDCDVEEPNLHLFFPATATTRDVCVPVPVVDKSACDLCGKCGEFCQYGALTVLPDRVLFFPELCHSCGGCMLICPKTAIREEPKRIGTLSTSAPLPGIKLITGTLDFGVPLAVPIIREAKKEVWQDPVVIIDSAPGTSCPVVEALDGCDACVLVTESTPFGLHDLRLAVDVTARMGIPAGVIINRSDGKDEETIRFCADNDLDIMMTIPFSREIAAIQNRGNLLCRVQPEWQKDFLALFCKCQSLVGVDQ